MVCSLAATVNGVVFTETAIGLADGIATHLATQVCFRWMRITVQRRADFGGCTLETDMTFGSEQITGHPFFSLHTYPYALGICRGDPFRWGECVDTHAAICKCAMGQPETGAVAGSTLLTIRSVCGGNCWAVTEKCIAHAGIWGKTEWPRRWMVIGRMDAWITLFLWAAWSQIYYLETLTITRKAPSPVGCRL